MHNCPEICFVVCSFFFLWFITVKHSFMANERSGSWINLFFGVCALPHFCKNFTWTNQFSETAHNYHVWQTRAFFFLFFLFICSWCTFAFRTIELIHYAMLFITFEPHTIFECLCTFYLKLNPLECCVKANKIKRGFRIQWQNFDGKKKLISSSCNPIFFRKMFLLRNSKYTSVCV